LVTDHPFWVYLDLFFVKAGPVAKAERFPLLQLQAQCLKKWKVGYQEGNQVTIPISGQEECEAWHLLFQSPV
jgi:hypothetical protein